MKKADIQLNGVYVAKVNGQLTKVRVTSIREVPGYARGFGKTRDTTVYGVTNLKTGRETQFRSATKFRSAVPSTEEPK